MNTSAELSPRRRRRRFLVGYDEGDLPVKREPDDDIKDYAENTMNELLGWYGYEKVDSRDTQGLNLTHFASNNNNSGPGASNHSNQTNGFSPPSSAMEGSDASEDVASHHGGLEGSSSGLRPDSVSPGPDASAASDEVARQHQQMVSALSSITKHPGAPDSPNLPPGCIVCAWCQKVGMKLFTLKTPNGCKAFCSELCFTQCRRASFKKNKICDWCKHVRHTVNYVDFQDGEQQLQFCSDKCLNQYKMNIFCKETQAHLQMHTHLKEAACKMAAGSSVNLITPELWLRDCKTNGNSNSPHETVDVTEDINSDDNISAAPSPNVIVESPRPVTPAVKEKTEHSVESLHTPKEKDKVPKKHSSKHSPKKSFGEPRFHQSMKHHRDKRPTDVQLSSDNVPNNRHSPSHATPPPLSRSNQITNGSHSLLSSPPMPRPPQPHIGPPPNRHCPPVTSPLPINNMEHGRHFVPPNMMAPPFQFFAQQHMEAVLRSQHGLDLRSKVPPPWPMPPWVMPPFPPVPPPPHPHLPPPARSSRSPSQSHSSPPSRGHVHTPSHKSTHHVKHKHNKHGATNSNHPISQPPKTTPSASESQLPSSLLPPVTVMVPFPLVLPLPLPIPVPIPIPPSVMDKFKRHQEQQKTIEEHLDSSIQKYHHQKKQKSTSSKIDSSKHRKKLRLSENGERDLRFPIYGPEMHTQLVSNTENFLGRSENVSFKPSEIVSVDYPESEKSRNFLRRDIDLGSGSYSPLSDVISSDDCDEMKRTLKNSDSNNFSNINFSSYSLNLLRSSPSVVSQTAGHHSPKMLNENEEYSACPSPANLTVSDKKRSNMSSDPLNFKKKHLREQLSLMT